MSGVSWGTLIPSKGGAEFSGMIVGEVPELPQLRGRPGGGSDRLGGVAMRWRGVTDEWFWLDSAIGG